MAHSHPFYSTLLIALLTALPNVRHASITLSPAVFTLPSGRQVLLSVIHASLQDIRGRHTADLPKRLFELDAASTTPRQSRSLPSLPPALSRCKR